jgi:hypothetical protein
MDENPSSEATAYSVGEDIPSILCGSWSIGVFTKALD